MERAPIGLGAGTEDMGPGQFYRLSADLGIDRVKLIDDLVITQGLAAAPKIEVAFDEFDLVLAEAFCQ